MQFTDIVFALFMSIFFCIYWLALRNRLKMQNLWLLLASYVFYGWWDWRFLILIIITSVATYASALLFYRYKYKWVIFTNIYLNLGILVIFKYFNFFSENLSRLFGLFGIGLDWFTVDVLLPVGISFYTFQAIGYSIDVMRKDIKPTTDIVSFFTFIAFFPQLVAGPIESAKSLLPQIKKKRVWDEAQAVKGLRMILFGLLKKLCVANMFGIYVDRIFNNPELTPILVLTGAVLFSLQLYCDFSAYSEIARGCAAILGINLMINFRFPYFSRNILEFWQKWHISLMLWFRNYLYIPLGGNRKGKARTMINLCIVFILSGLWHGAAWNFVIWGAYWALCYLAGRFILKLDRHPHGEISIKDLPKILLTFGIVSFGFFIFRCPSIIYIIIGLKSLWLFIVVFVILSTLAKLMMPLLMKLRLSYKKLVVFYIVWIIISILTEKWIYLLKFWWFLPLLLVSYIEWTSRNNNYPFSIVPNSRYKRWIVYWVMMICIILSEPTEMTFIYFQF